MFKKILLSTTFLAFSLQFAHAGQGTIRETEDAIIIEYSGENDEEVKAALKAKEREEKQAEVDAEKRKAKAEQGLEKEKAKAAIREQKGPRVRESEEELKKE
jgi:hypothetical protein